MPLFVLEEGAEGGLATIAPYHIAILSEIAEIRAAQTGKLKQMPDRVVVLQSYSNPIKAASAHWVRKWKQEVSGWLQVTLSHTLLRRTSRASAVYGSSRLRAPEVAR